MDFSMVPLLVSLAVGPAVNPILPLPSETQQQVGLAKAIMEAAAQVLPDCHGVYEVTFTPGAGVVYTCAPFGRTGKMDLAINGTLWVLGGLFMADTASTIVAIQKGATEQNPVLKGFHKHPVATAFAKGVLGMVSVLAIDRLRDLGKKKLALIVGLLEVALYTGVVWSNTHWTPEGAR